jgi:exonuclease SbcC
MKPKKLTLTGFAGIKSGVGKDSITLDLDAISDDATLVALVGPNGAGKSTVMDNLHPYRIMPSRATSYSPAAFSYYDWLSQTEASKVLDWESGGKHYRSMLSFKVSGSRRKTDAYLYEMIDAELVPVSMPDGTVSDGKTETYDSIVEYILGSPETFFTSVFSAQNRRPISSYGNAEIKTLMADLLGLESIRELGKRANAITAGIKPIYQQRRTELDALEKKRAEMDNIGQQSLATQERLADLNRQTPDLKEAVKSALVAVAKAEAQVAAEAEVRQRRTNLKARLEESAARKQKYVDGVAAMLHATESGHNNVQKERRTEIEQLARQETKASTEITRLQGLIKRADTINAAVKRSIEIQVLIDGDRREYDALQTTLQGAAELEALVNKSSVHLATLKTQGSAASTKLEELHARGALITEVPCKGTDLQGRCKLLGDAVNADKEIPTTIITVEKFREDYRATRTRLEYEQEQRKSYAEIETKAAGLLARMRGLENEARGIASIVAEATLLADAQGQLSQWTERLAEIGKSIASKEAAFQKGESNLIEGLDKIHKESSEDLQRRDQEILAISSELDGLPASNSNLLDQAKTEQQRADDVWKSHEDSITSATATHRTLESQMAMIEKDLSGTTNLQNNVERLEQEIAHWTLLGKACGNDGIIALSIDDAGPTLSAYANELLLSCYGPRFTVSIRTQVETAKGEAREGFDVVVFDAETEDEKSVSTMSGGERVWINEALTRAIALYLAKESGQQYQTLFTDEADGPLDPERKRMFMQMKREVLRIGGYHREFFISQTPELWEMADETISIKEL